MSGTNKKKSIESFKSSIENCFDDICASILIAIPPFGEIISVNLETEELTGYEASELIGMKLPDIFSPKDKPRIQSLFAESKVENLDFKRLFEHNIIIQKRSKRKIIVDMGIKLKHHKDFTAFVFTLQDITELKNSEQEITNAHSYVNDILTSMTESLFVVDKDFNIKTINTSACQLLEYDQDQLIDKPAYPIFSDTQVFEKLSQNDEIETEVRTQSGHCIPVLAFLTPLQSSSDKNGLSVLVAVDMTERKKAEQLIAEQQMMLVQSSKMSALGVMASGIAHEINNPLHIINGNCEILAMLLEEVPVDVKGLGDSIQVIDQMTSRIDNIIRGLSAFSRDERSEPPELTPLSEIVDATLMLCETRIQNSGVSFIIPDIDPKLHIECRPTQISQVLLNLFNNAYDEIRQDDKPRIELKVESLQDSVKMYVTNSGPKISKEICESIFNPFYTTKPVGEGTGLGLSISKSIMESHSGDLYVDLQKKNTTFVIEIPKRSAKGDELKVG